LPVSWSEGPNGAVIGRENLTPAQQAVLDRVVAAHDPARQPRRVISKMVIRERIKTAGKIPQAVQMLMSNPELFSRWTLPGAVDVYSDDPDTVTFVRALGLDPAVILAVGS
jgi:hypothetical protein